MKKIKLISLIILSFFTYQSLYAQLNIVKKTDQCKSVFDGSDIWGRGGVILEINNGDINGYLLLISGVKPKTKINRGRVSQSTEFNHIKIFFPDKNSIKKWIDDMEYIINMNRSDFKDSNIYYKVKLYHNNKLFDYELRLYKFMGQVVIQWFSDEFESETITHLYIREQLKNDNIQIGRYWESYWSKSICNKYRNKFLEQMSLLGNLSEPITRDDLLKLGWERISKNTLTTQIHVDPYSNYPYSNYSWFSNYWGESIYYDVKQRKLRIRDKVYRNISDMMELDMIIESFTNPKY